MTQKTGAKKLSALLVGDDEATSDTIVPYLSRQNIEITVVADGKEMDLAFQTKNFDLVVLDLAQSGEDGFSICQRIRQGNAVPIITTSNCHNNVDKIISLEIGADDYIPKPLDPREILARIRALSRRVEMSKLAKPAREKGYLFSDWRLEIQARKLVGFGGVHLPLTSAECCTLRVFCENAGQVLSRGRLIELTHDEIDSPSERSVDIIVSRLRHKIEANPSFPKIIRTIRFEGYIFTARVERLPES